MFSYVFVIFLLTYPCQSCIGTRMTQNLTELNRKLRRFEVQAAKRSCCSKGHRMPDGELIPCDRALIYQSFSAWYDTKATENLTGLDMFNTAVRHEYGSQILQACGGSQMIPLNLFIYLVFSINTPFLIRNIHGEMKSKLWAPHTLPFDEKQMNVVCPYSYGSHVQFCSIMHL